MAVAWASRQRLLKEGIEGVFRALDAQLPAPAGFKGFNLQRLTPGKTDSEDESNILQHTLTISIYLDNIIYNIHKISMTFWWRRMPMHLRCCSQLPPQFQALLSHHPTWQCLVGAWKIWSMTFEFIIQHMHSQQRVLFKVFLHNFAQVFKIYLSYCVACTF